MRPLLLLACATLGAGALLPADQRWYPDVKDYRKWTKVTKEPEHLAPRLEGLCVQLPPAFISEKNPHIKKYFNVYVNEKGRKAFYAKKPLFPEGTVIVKEKLPSKKGKPELLTVMVKCEKGYDPKNGDWAYFTFDGKAKHLPTTTTHCASCHQDKKKGNYVFRGYGGVGSIRG